LNRVLGVVVANVVVGSLDVVVASTMVVVVGSVVGSADVDAIIVVVSSVMLTAVHYRRTIMNSSFND